MRAGMLRQVIHYQTLTEAPDSFGDLLKSFATVATFRGEIRAPNGRELLNASQLKAVITHIVVIRHPGYALDPKARLLWGSVLLQIAFCADPDGRRRQLHAHCTELVPS